MGKEKHIGPGLGVVLLASIVLASVYFTSRAAQENDSYYYQLSQRMDRAIAEAYGIPFVH